MTNRAEYVLLLFLSSSLDIAAEADPRNAAEDDLGDAELVRVHRAALARLREKAMDLADRLHASADEPDADIGEIATKFARVARAVRQTIALEARLADDARRIRDAERAAKAAEAAAQEAERNKVRIVTGPSRAERRAERDRTAPERRLEVLGLMHRAIAKDVDRDRLDARFHERLTDDDDGYGKLISYRSVTETIEHICRDLGFTPDWLGLSDRDWKLAKPETRAALLGESPPPKPPPLSSMALARIADRITGPP